MIPFTITDPSKRSLAAYLVRLDTAGKAELYDPVAKAWTTLTTFGATTIPVTQLATSDLYVGQIDQSVIDATHTNMILACPAGGGEPIGTPAYVDTTPAPINGQTVIINVGKPF